MFQTPEARELKIMVVGHADAQGIKGREAPRALSEQLAPERRPRAGRGRLAAQSRHSRRPHGRGRLRAVPADFAATTRPSRAQTNRRVEIYVLGPETPVVGWTENHDTVYR